MKINRRDKMDRLWEIFEKFSDIANMESEHIFEDFLRFL